MTLSTTDPTGFDSALLERLLRLDGTVGPPGTAADAAASIVADPAREAAPFPLTEIQRSYLIGRDPSLPLGGTSCQVYYEIDCDALDIDRYASAWNRTIARHGMLRAVIEDATRQRILPAVPPLVPPVHDLRDAADPEAMLEPIRTRLAGETRPHDAWPLFAVEISLLPDGHRRVHVAMDMLICDQQSFLRILDDVATLYADPDTVLPPIGLSFRDYVLQVRDEPEAQARDRGYWRAKRDTLPDAPALPLAGPLGAVPTPPAFETLDAEIDPARWSRLQALAGRLAVTPSVLLLAVFGEVLARFSDAPRFCLNTTMYDRRPLHPDVDALVGDFTSTMLFEMEVQPGETWRGLIERLQRDLWRDMEHRACSGLAMAADLARYRGRLDGVPMPVVFTSTLTQNDTRLLGRARAQPGRQICVRSRTPQVILDNQMIEWEGALRLRWDVVPAAFAGPVPARLLAAMMDHLAALADDPGLIDAPPARPDPSAADLVPPLVAPAPATRLHDLWLDRLPAAAARPAVATASGTVTHGELAARVAGIADLLRRHGVRPGEPVALLGVKGVDQIAACLAVAIAGGAYVPIDAAQPAARQSAILADLAPRLTLAAGARPPDSFAGTVIDVATVPPGDTEDLTGHAGASADHLAYVIYTSGSTGAPKGVAVSHAAAVNTVLDVNARFGLGMGDVVLGLSALHFDLSVHDVFGVLGAGGCLVLPDAAEQRNPSHWLALCRQHGVTVWNTVPSLFGLFVETCALAPAASRSLALRTALLSGDWIPVDLPGRARALWPNLEMISLGGATEAAIWSIFHRIETVDPAWTSIPYGRALGGQQVFVLDEGLAIAPPGKTGELFVAGRGLACGYYGDGERTAAQFLAHPRTGLRLYRTGDLGRYREDGTIEFLGRRDEQVKIDGHRVETGEVVAALRAHPAVREAVVLATEGRAHRRLVAHVEADDVAFVELDRWLRSRLPDHFVPARWSRVTRWPLTANGKVDRAALRRAETVPAQPDAAAGVAPPAAAADPIDDSPAMATVLAMVRDILGGPAPTADDSLVALGASSVDLITLATRIEAATGTRPPLPRLAAAAQLRDLAALVAELGGTGTGAEAGRPPARAAWSAAERRLDDYVAKRPPILDAEARRLFKRSLRRWRPAGEAIDLAAAPIDDLILARRSWRAFDRAPFARDRLAATLAVLREAEVAGQPRRAYASAGGRYPLETHVWIAPGRVAGLAAGAWWYDPQSHRLVHRVAAPCPPIATPGNAGWLDGAAFVLCFALALDVVAPLYDRASLAFGLIECGAVCQLLETAAMENGLGLCQVGDAPLETLHAALRLGPDQPCLHVAAGGAIAAADLAAWRAAPVGSVAPTLEGSL
ncbi:amino acid adenylation domain-containing protein [Rhodoplanes sp. TEM]|uniref:Amino acid adenylation domain-containing protein n=1 Tax=Rhodoplanes tepidamans TaxID=200616 RepID=A0ABT5JCE8_RHOTP|nr:MULTISPECIES: amino acid adenylation domain-containing protein [Rhodoplanes]MDC7787041.1 amino acid adenylation domain-containing protein [Rhodoplanes tepidamans]MDC7988061.1 amino acid adenylation domain-containing protein [Rhodoplanes sp. TEM]MDQ0354232.1 amino acid adenylation domain-containing protein [Rhodoplanes tepidamans]